jgi:hypothetical protein
MLVEFSACVMAWVEFDELMVIVGASSIFVTLIVID